MRRNNYVYLFGGLSILLLLEPALAGYMTDTVASLVASVGICAVLVFGVFTFTRHRSAFYVGIVLAVGLIAMSILQHRWDYPAIRAAELCLLLAFLVIAIWLAGEDVLFSGHYDFNRIVGAVCIYQLLGLIWAVLYAGVEIVSPGALGDLTMASGSEIRDFIYFSFVTLTTLGYGDYAPQGPLVRALAYSEAVVGQLYVAIVIASLVGARLAEKSDDR
jgi:hypothetical protein